MSPTEFVRRSYASYRYRLERLLVSDFATDANHVGIRSGESADQSASCRDGLRIFRTMFGDAPEFVSEKVFEQGLWARTVAQGLWPLPRGVA